MGAWKIHIAISVIFMGSEMELGIPIISGLISAWGENLKFLV
jgi:hypothetical protein